MVKDRLARGGCDDPANRDILHRIQNRAELSSDIVPEDSVFGDRSWASQAAPMRVRLTARSENTAGHAASAEVIPVGERD